MRRAHDIPAAMINLRIGVAEQFGGIRAAILKEAGLTEEAVANPTNRVSVTATMSVWEAIVNQTGSHDIGLLSGSRLRLSSLGMLGYLAMNSETIEKALQKLCTYQRLVASIAFFSVQQSVATTRYVLELQEAWQPFFRYTIDFMLASMAAIIKGNTYHPTQPTDVGFSIPLPENAATYYDLFAPAKVHFDCGQNFLTYAKSDLARRVIGANSDLFTYFQRELDAALIHHNRHLKYTRLVRDQIQQKLKAELPRLDEVARDLGVSTRSLQGLLKKEATSFQGLLNEVRKEVAMTQLKNKTFNITEVAFLIGFSDLAVFSRSFKKWTGLTPSQYQLQA